MCAISSRTVQSPRRVGSASWSGVSVPTAFRTAPNWARTAVRVLAGSYVRARFLAGGMAGSLSPRLVGGVGVVAVRRARRWSGPSGVVTVGWVGAGYAVGCAVPPRPAPGSLAGAGSWGSPSLAGVSPSPFSTKVKARAARSAASATWRRPVAGDEPAVVLQDEGVAAAELVGGDAGDHPVAGLLGEVRRRGPGAVHLEDHETAGQRGPGSPMSSRSWEQAWVAGEPDRGVAAATRPGTGVVPRRPRTRRVGGGAPRGPRRPSGPPWARRARPLSCRSS